MATEKNITMKQFNGTDYDTLYPKTIASQIPDVYSKTDTITTETLSQLGLSADKLPNDAFQQIKTLIDNAQTSADGKAKIQTGSYVGTGTYGANNPCSLTFDFSIKVLLIGCTTNDYDPTISFFVYDYDRYSTFVPKARSGSQNSEGWYGYISWNDNTVNWNNTDSAMLQLNDTGLTYYYVAIG